MKFSFAFPMHCPICNNINPLSIRFNNLTGMNYGLNSSVTKFKTSLRSLHGNRITSNLEYVLDTSSNEMVINFLDDRGNHKSVIPISLINSFKQYNNFSIKNMIYGECNSCKEYRFHSNEFALSLKENNLYIEREIFDFKYESKSYYINNYPLKKSTEITTYNLNVSSTKILPLIPFCDKLKFCNKLKLLLPFY